MNYALLSLINLIFDILILLIFVEVIGSWVLAARVRLPDAIYRLLEVVHAITGPIMEPIRRVIPPLGGLDLSPLIALILLQIIQRLLVSVLVGLR
ncbi:MAG: YggT family protein [Anaerolineae bacterium]|nr:YggT family protein [Anaerolineae bacterium]